MHVFFHHELLNEPIRCSVSHVRGDRTLILCAFTSAPQLYLASFDGYFASLGPLTHCLSLCGVVDVEILFLGIEGTTGIMLDLILFLLFHRCFQQGHLLVNCERLFTHLAGVLSRYKPSKVINQQCLHLINCRESCMAFTTL